ncbi:hypothetical protein QP028_11715 [Corynebacterium suedekumii]|mgnify:FL=1|uniref:Integral membrane protein n=1 Tax=Corynebacterium suedekumii TaxID=3049801 RepID=A0ABY8VNI5_9CORY|nr:hypothetical protein [Corynebacterium suedekumii]WIM70345.1 hypothetical protein QP029_00255 [Corynebacterium suedekumii]WIM72044.1 hypothetical protein QP028_11715 [Corynebacterium suedekumii]
MQTSSRLLWNTGLPAAVPSRDRAHRLAQRSAPGASLLGVIASADTALATSLSQEDWEALYGATDEGLVLDRLVWPLTATATAIIIIPLLLWLLLRVLPGRVGIVVGVIVLAWSAIYPAIYPAIYLVEFWFSLAWTVLVVLLTCLGWAYLTHWTLVRALREIPDSLRQSLFYLPLLLVAFLFFFFNSNLWQLAVA